MKKITAISTICAIAISTYASDLGTIRVESSTIDDKFESKRTEVSSTSTISGETVDKAHIENIQQVLRAIPGITTESSTGDTLKIHMRGVENQMYMGEKPGVAIVIDGVPVFERTGKVNIDLDNIESIKVIKGGASYLFGDDALSGAVIITTKRGAKYDHNYGAFEAGSYGYKKAVARTGYSNEDLSFHVQASQRSGDGYHEDSDYKTSYLNGKLQYYLNDTSDINFGVEYSQREKDSHGTVGGKDQAETNPESVYDGDMESRDYTRLFDVELLKTFITYSKDFSKNTNLLVNTYAYTDDTSYWSAPQTKNAAGFDGTYTDEDYTQDNYYEQIQTGLKSELRTSSKKFATLLGIDIRDNSYKNKVISLANYKLYPGDDLKVVGQELDNDKTKENVYAIYGEYKQSIVKDLTATLNLRNDTIQHDYTDNLDATKNGDSSFNVYSYRIGANYNINADNILFTNYSTGFRAPTISQLYGGSCSTYSCTKGNLDLVPEESLNYEIGLRGKTTNMSYELAIFRIDRNDFLMKTSGNYGDSSYSNPDMWDNVGGAKHQGAELSIKQIINEQFNYNIAYTYLDAKYTDYTNFDLGGTFDPVDVTGNTIPRTSKHTANFTLDYKPTKSLSFMTEINARSKYYADDKNEIEINSHGIVSLMATYEREIASFESSFFVRAENVLDKQYYRSARSSSDRNEDGKFDAEDLSITVDPGRVITAGLSAKF